MTIRTIALNTFKEAVRDRILYLLFFFAAATLVLSRVLALLTVGDRVKIIKDVGLASLSLFGTLMAILIGTGLVYKEIDKKTIFTLLSKPIGRGAFLVGKFAGLVLTLFVLLGLMSIIFLVILFLHSFRFEAVLLIAIFYIFLELILITAVAILFSCFSTPILSSIFTLSFTIIGHSSWGLKTLIKKIPPGLGRTLARIAYVLLPDLESLNFKTEVVHGIAIPPAALINGLLYALCFSAFVLALATLVFRKRDFI
jgi:ABC-type transport system involved in multi-copper enzyme maturation permease subunit